MIDVEGNIKLIDFGTACEFDPQVGMTDLLGTIMYIAPEVLRNREAYN